MLVCSLGLRVIGEEIKEYMPQIWLEKRFLSEIVYWTWLPFLTKRKKKSGNTQWKGVNLLNISYFAQMATSASGQKGLNRNCSRTKRNIHTQSWLTESDCKESELSAGCLWKWQKKEIAAANTHKTTTKRCKMIIKRCRMTIWDKM